MKVFRAMSMYNSRSIGDHRTSSERKKDFLRMKLEKMLESGARIRGESKEVFAGRVYNDGILRDRMYRLSYGDEGDLWREDKDTGKKILDDTLVMLEVMDTIERLVKS